MINVKNCCPNRSSPLSLSAHGYHSSATNDVLGPREGRRSTVLSSAPTQQHRWARLLQAEDVHPHTPDLLKLLAFCLLGPSASGVLNILDSAETTSLFTVP